MLAKSLNTMHSFLSSLFQPTDSKTLHQNIPTIYYNARIMLLLEQICPLMLYKTYSFSANDEPTARVHNIHCTCAFKRTTKTLVIEYIIICSGGAVSCCALCSVQCDDSPLVSLLRYIAHYLLRQDIAPTAAQTCISRLLGARVPPKRRIMFTQNAHFHALFTRNHQRHGNRARERERTNTPHSRIGALYVVLSQ